MKIIYAETQRITIDISLMWQTELLPSSKILIIFWQDHQIVIVYYEDNRSNSIQSSIFIFLKYPIVFQS